MNFLFHNMFPVPIMLELAYGNFDLWVNLLLYFLNALLQASMDETFYLSIILPQDHNNNAGFWNRLEIFCRDLTERYRDVWITSGPLFLPKVRDDGRKVVEYEVRLLR